MNLTTPITLEIGKSENSERVGLTVRQRSQHLLVAGSIGSGKTTAMSSCIRQDIRHSINGNCSVVVVDPMGALYESAILGCAQNAADGEEVAPIICHPGSLWVTPFNVFQRNQGPLEPQVERRVAAILQATGLQASRFEDYPRLYKWLYCLVWVIMERDLTVLEAIPLLRDERFRLEMIKDLQHATVAQMMSEISSLGKDLLNNIESTVNRLFRFSREGVLGRAMGLQDNSLDARSIMAGGKILLCNLAAKNLSFAQLKLLGTFLVVEFFEAAMERANNSKPCYFYIDEASMFLIPEVAEALDRCRQKGLHFILGFQRLSQFRRTNPDVYEAITGSVLNRVILNLADRRDATEFAESMFRDLAEPQVAYFTEHLNHRLEDTYLPTLSASSGFSRAVTKTRSNTLGETETQSSMIGLFEGDTAGSGSSEFSSSATGASESLATSVGGLQAEGEDFEQLGKFTRQMTGAGTSSSSGNGKGSNNFKAHSSGKTEAHGESRGVQRSATEGESISETPTESFMVGLTPATLHEPITEYQPVTYTLEENKWRAAELLMFQPTGHAWISIGQQPPVPCWLPKPAPLLISPVEALEFIKGFYRASAIPWEKARRKIEERQDKLFQPQSGIVKRFSRPSKKQ